MLDSMRRLHPRGAANRGICVDAEGATLGPDCVLVSRTSHGFQPIDRNAASQLQKCLMGTDRDEDWLFRQCRRIADALDQGEIALAQIYGLRIPIGGLDDRQLARTSLSKSGFNPDEPRVPRGDPHGGEWTGNGDDSGEARPAVEALLADFTGTGDSADATLLGSDVAAPSSTSSPSEPADANGQSASSDGPPIKWEMKPLPAGPAPPAPSADGNNATITFDSPDLQSGSSASADSSENPILATPGIDAINADYSIENLLLLLATWGSSGTLRRALRALGLLRKGDQAHHIVPQWDRRADPAREVLERYGIDINDPVNGVGLPPQQHWKLNATAYHEWVNKALAGVRTKAEAEDILRSIGRRLQEGTWP